MNLIEQLVELVKEIETEDPIDFAMLQIDEDTAYTLMATSILEMYLSNDADSRDMILLATVIKLTVENFVLNLKLLQNVKPV